VLLFLPTREELESVYDALVSVNDAVTGAKRTTQARAKLRALLAAPRQHEQIKQFISRIIDLEKTRMEKYARAALERLFVHTAHYDSAISNRSEKARSKAGPQI
jgi:hypothetical protein